MLVIGVQPGDRRNWVAIRKWAAGLEAAFRTAPSQAQEKL
jgi:hypothetical protein